MLTSGELKLISTVISVCSWLGVLPFDINTSTCKLRRLTTLRTVWRWLCFTVCAVHLAYANYRFAELYLIGEPAQVPTYVYVFHLCYSFLLTLHMTVNIVVAYGKRDLLIQVFNKIEASHNTRWRHWKKYSFHDLVTVLFFPYSILGLYTLFPAVIFTERRMTQTMLKSPIMEPYTDNPWIFLATFLLDSYAGCYFFANFFFLLAFFFLACGNVLEDICSIEETLRTGDQAEDVYQAAQECRVVQLYITLFNQANSTAFYGTKIAMNVAGIVFGYIAIRHFDANVVLGSASYLLLVGSFVVYAFICDAANRIVDQTAHIHKRIAEVMTQRREEQRLNTETRLMLRSLKVIGVRVGSFNEVEQESTLVFVDFVLNQLVGLLLAFPE